MLSMRRILILYGSQTGTAEDVANQIALDARRLHLSVTLAAMDDYDRQSLFEECYIIFVVSTTGQGTEPQNMNHFWRSLRQANLPADLFGGLQFTVFGLGDSSYPKYNWAAKKLYRRMVQLSAREFYPRGEADDQNPNGIETTLTPWLTGLRSRLLDLMPLPHNLTALSDTVCLPPRYSLRPCCDETCPKTKGAQASSSTIGTLTKNSRLTPEDHWQDTRHLEFEFEEEIEFEPGSVASLLPENSPEDVSKFLRLMKWETVADQVFQLSSAIEGVSLPDAWSAPATLRQMFTTRFDFLAVPKKTFISWLSHFTSNHDHTERLREFCSSDGQDDLYDYINRPKRTILEVVSDFKSASIPLDYIPDVFPQIRPRQFSIASSPKAFPRQIHLLVAVVHYRTRISTPRKGLCTSWMARLTPGTRVPVRIERGCFDFPHDPSSAVICIGPGTGIAPFRSLVQDRAVDRPQTMSHLIIYGCRNVDKDFYYKDEWTLFQDQGVCKLYCAASRDQAQKRYVQHKIEEHADEVWKFLSAQKATILISGSAGQMPKAVRKALGRVCCTQGEMDEAKAQEYVEMLDRTGRLQEETWS